MSGNTSDTMNKSWIFTFGQGHPNQGHFVRIPASSPAEAREKMIAKYGLFWAFQYTEKEWADWEKFAPAFMVETEIPWEPAL